MKTFSKIGIIVSLFVFLTAAIGVPVIEHVCYSSNTTTIALFSDTCEKDTQKNSCCNDKQESSSKKCCENKYTYHHLVYQGQKENNFKLKFSENKTAQLDFFSFHQAISKSQILFSFRALPLPDKIRAQAIIGLISTSPELLQVFRC